MQADYALVLAAIAVVCILAVLFLGGAVSGLFDSSAKPLTPGSAPFTPPSAPTEVYPTTIAECENGGWKNFPQFESKAACIDYVKSLSP